MKKEGDSIKPGDILAQIETDKATVDFEMQEEGYIAKLLFPEGAKDVKLGTVVAIIVDSMDDVSKFKEYSAEGSAPKVEAPKKAEVEQKRACPASMERPQSTPDSAAAGVRIIASPIAKKTAEESNVDLSKIQGSGPNNRIIKTDVESAKQTSAKPAPPKIQIPTTTGVEFEDIPLTNIRKVIADRLTYSKTNIPHYYVTVSVNVDNLLALRTKLNGLTKTKISVNDMVIKASSLASVKVPETNSSWMGETIRRFKNVNMCIAIQTDFGLMAPTLFNTHLKGLEEIAAEVKDIAARARENKLKPHELQDGTFTVSNLGMFGVHNFSAIVNPPQACILAVSAASKVVVPDEATNGFKVANVMNVTLSSDHRVVDGAVAAQWGQEFKKFIENPEFMLL